ncbi:MAG TPA: choice-of-anchor tandem repeat GloVer-containing protein [Candidatus Binatia bacterium]|nr:choice-of-anchor tandem repeat GloVer-containing protein [Candidatus Binatia bacterium]
MRANQPTRLNKFFRYVNLAALLAAAVGALTANALSQTEQVLYSFVPRSGGYPQGGVVIDSQGNLYGTNESGDQGYGFGAVFELTPATGGGWTETPILTFHKSSTGTNPAAGLAWSASGNLLYGTTMMGGEGNNVCIQGCGTVYQLAKNSGGTWGETVIHEFAGGVDGLDPIGGVVTEPGAIVYGTTAYGGKNNCGVVFKLEPAQNWHETILHTFTCGVDGAVPSASLVMDATGNLYGTTYAGGNTSECAGTKGCGVAFELSPSGSVWKETILHTFTGGVDGANPLSNLIFDASGNLYGTASSGGDLSACSEGCGTVFELSHTAQGWKTTVIRSFGGGADGANPGAGLIFDAAGNLYGTTVNGGYVGYTCAGRGCGTVFELSPANGVWGLTSLHAFKDNGDGAWPNGNLVFDSAGNLYGTTSGGGTDAAGTVFEITP